MPAILDTYRRAWAGLWLFALVMIGITWVLVFAWVQESRSQHLEATQQNLFNLSRVSQEHALRTFRGADQAVRFIQARYLAEGDRLDLKGLAQQGVIDTEIFPQVGIIDEHGIYKLSNRPIAGTLDLSDREHFKVHVAADTGELYVSKPVLGRATGAWSIQLTRRITRSDGSFAGVVVVSIALDYFTQFYRDLRMGSGGLLALYGLDGVARVRKVGDLEEFGVNATRALAFDRIRQGQLEGFYTTASAVDGVERIHHYRKVPGYSLVVFTGVDTTSLYALHASATKGLWLGGGVVTALIVALAAALTRYLSQLRRALGLRLEAQQQIQDRNEQLGAIFDLSPDGFASFDTLQRISYISPAFSQLTGQGSATLMGLHEDAFSALLNGQCAPDTPFAGVAAMRAQVQWGAREMGVIELVRPVRRVLQVGLRCSSSRQVSQILYLRDVTHETEVDHMKSEFLSAAAHELRTPMASILGFSEVLLDADFDRDERQDFLKTIHANSQLMAKILDDLLDLARIEARQGKDFCYEQVDLCALLPAWVQAYPLPDDRQAPTLTMPPGPIFLTADPGKLHQALRNVLSNAYKYSPGGGPVHIHVAQSLAPPGSPSEVRIEVTDHGMGMTPAQLARVCERFYRADASGKHLGTGLGMSIVQEIVALHHGELSLESTLGQGTCVRISLPSTSARHHNVL